MSRRSYCRCAVVQNYDYDQAAAKLGCKRSWLENNISDLPHQKFGQAPAFCDCELALIQAMNTVLPPGVLALLADQGEGPQTPEPEPVNPLHAITPAGAPGRKAS